MADHQKPVTAIIIGAGSRGMTYAQFSHEHPDRLQIVGVAEPLEWNRQTMASMYSIPAENVAKDWRDLAARPKMADAVIICTQDAMHAEPAIAFAKKGYAMLLEKPMAPNEGDCQRIITAVKKNNILFGLCHVMRYTQYTQALKAILDSGAIGEIISIQHLEPVGYWHQAHSFVRGNWCNEKESSCMLLAKSCHDLDWIRYMVGIPCRSVSSFGALTHFKKSEKPAAAGLALRCLDCNYEPDCPYSAKKIYLGRVLAGETDWPLTPLTPVPTLESVTAALENGPYGRCVYECDNDVVDHQVVNLIFENNATAQFTMTAFNKAAHRKTRIFGTRGEISGDGSKIEIFDFLTDQTRIIDTEAVSADASGQGIALGGHGGGDYGVMDHFVAAIAQNDSKLILSGPDETLESHRMVFAAEKARLTNTVVNLKSE
jgi:predicted dehydrogenase